MTDLIWALILIAFAVGVLVGAVPTYSAWQAENDRRDQQRRNLTRRCGQVELENYGLRRKLAAVTGHPSATVVPIKRDAR